MGDSVIIDGSHGEGGGQVLRTALTLSAITGRPLKIARLRVGRPKPGLAAQHLTAVTRHLETYAWVIGQFGLADVLIERRAGGPALVSVRPKVAAAAAQGRPA
jgi:RNA 3'-terminal phosphate cyclase